MQVTSNVGDVIRRLERLQANIKKVPDTVVNVAEKDARVTEEAFLHAPTTTVDVKPSMVHVVRLGNVIYYSAYGDDVSFIEFGTGIRYPDTNPLAKKVGAKRGGYGKGQGANPPWVFDEVPGVASALSEEIPTKDGSFSFYKTEGQPASMPMFFATQRLPVKIKWALKEIKL